MKVIVRDPPELEGEQTPAAASAAGAGESFAKPVSMPEHQLSGGAATIRFLNRVLGPILKHGHNNSWGPAGGLSTAPASPTSPTAAVAAATPHRRVASGAVRSSAIAARAAAAAQPVITARWEADPQFCCHGKPPLPLGDSRGPFRFIVTRVAPTGEGGRPLPALEEEIAFFESLDSEARWFPSHVAADALNLLWQQEAPETVTSDSGGWCWR